MKTGLIYKLTSPSGRIYVGQTYNFKTRAYHYETLDCKGQKKLYDCLKFYGFDSFSVEILMDDVPELFMNDMEIEYIKQYDSFLGKNGLNGTEGGGAFGAGANHPCFGKPGHNKGKKLGPQSEATKKKRSLSLINRPRSEEVKQKLRKPKTPRTKEHIKNHSLAMKGKIPWNKGKKSKKEKQCDI